jgi:hypothetical protein
MPRRWTAASGAEAPDARQVTSPLTSIRVCRAAQISAGDGGGCVPDAIGKGELAGLGIDRSW